MSKMKRLNNARYPTLCLGFVTLVILILSFALGAIGQETRPLLVLYAFPEEGQAIAARMTTNSTEHILGRDVHIGVLDGKRIVLAESGMGMTNAAMTTQALISRFQPHGLVFSGIAGAIDSSVHIGDLCICARWITHDYVIVGPDSLSPQPIPTYSATADSIVSVRSLPADSGYIAQAAKIGREKLALKKIGTREPRISIGGVGVSGNAFINNSEKRLWLSQRFKALVTDMESAAVAQVCFAQGVPFVIIRSASDLAGGSSNRTATEELEQFFRIAAANSSALVIELIGQLP
jgi:adenosylhomocysteine nucleosidase